MSKTQSKVTIVTAYFTVPSKQTKETYLGWINNFVKLDENMIIFTDKENNDYISSLRDLNKTHIIVTSIQEFEVYKYIDYWNYCKEIDSEKQIHTVELYMIWNEKSFFCEKAIKSNIFRSEFFYWMDIGCVRDSEMLRYIPKINVDNIPQDTVILSQVEYKNPSVELNNGISQTFENVSETNSCLNFVYIQGGFFGGYINGLSKWIELYRRELDLFVRTKTFGGKDQYIMANILIKYPDNIYCMSPVKYEYGHVVFNNWWSFLVRLSDYSSTRGSLCW